MGLRDALIAAALDRLEADGEEPSLRAVARAAGVSAMAPYNHFPDRAALMAAVSDHGFATLRDALAGADDRPDAREALVAQGMAFVDFARAHPALFRVMYGHRYGGADSAAVTATYDVLAARVGGLVASDAGAAALACRALVQGLATIVLSGRLAPSAPEDVALAVRLFVAGLGAREAQAGERAGPRADRPEHATRRDPPR